MSLTSTSASKADDVDPAPTRSPSDDGAVLPVYLDWSKDSVFPLPDMASQSPLFDCWQSGSDSFIGAYALHIQRPCRYTPTEEIGANETIESFQLSGIVFSTEIMNPGVFQTALPLEGNINGQPLMPTAWTVGTTGRCARVTWTASTSGLGIGQGEFLADSIRFANALYVSEAVLMVRDPTVTSAQTVVPSSTFPTPGNSPPIGASASPVSGTSASSSGPSTSVIVPAVLVPVLVITAAVAAFLVWRARQRRRARLAPSAAFRADHAETIARGVEGNNEAVRALSPVPSNVNAYVPIDEKRGFF